MYVLPLKSRTVMNFLAPRSQVGSASPTTRRLFSFPFVDYTTLQIINHGADAHKKLLINFFFRKFNLLQMISMIWHLCVVAVTANSSYKMQNITKDGHYMKLWNNQNIYTLRV